MIRITTNDGRHIYLDLRAIASIEEAGTSSQWHGIRSYVTTFDGKTIETEDHASDIVKRMDAQEGRME